MAEQNNKYAQPNVNTKTRQTKILLTKLVRNQLSENKIVCGHYDMHGAMSLIIYNFPVDILYPSPKIKTFLTMQLLYFTNPVFLYIKIVFN